MINENSKILAIETSCDETAAAVIGVVLNPKTKDLSPIILSSVVSSQIDLHAKTGGIVPEVASRAHMEAITPVITEALIQASYKLQVTSNKKKTGNSKLVTSNYSEAIKVLQNEITHIAVTAGPGLIGSLLVGFNAAKTIAYSLNKPIIPVNHIEGHIYSAFAEQVTSNKLQVTSKELGTSNSELVTEIKFPILALTVSGGHTSLTILEDHVEYKTIGETKDDAAGEAFDKVARLLELGYPGGPVVSRMAEEYRKKISGQKWTTNKTNHEMSETLSCPYGSLSIPDRKAVIFPRPILNDGTFNFSFSGLKTAVLVKVKKMTENGHELIEGEKQEICAAFEDAAIDVLVTKTIRAVEKYKPKTLVLAGGVAANKHLREMLANKVSSIKYQAENRPQLLIPPMELCGDNAAMIGIAAFYHLQKGSISAWNKIKVDSNLEIGSRS